MVFLRHLQLFSLRIWRVLHISCLFKRLDSVHNFLRYKTVRVEKIDCVHITQDLTSSTILKGFKSVMRLNVLWKLFLGDNFGWFWKSTSKNSQTIKKKNAWTWSRCLDFMGRKLRSIFVWIFQYLFFKSHWYSCYHGIKTGCFARVFL